MIVYHSVKQSHLLDTLESGSTLDAFRHTYAMAYLARHIKIAKLKKLGIAHEKGNKLQFKKQQKEYGERPDSLACEMDLRNNNVGFEIGKNSKTSSDEELKQQVLREIYNGSTWYLKRNAKNDYVTCDDIIIDIDKYQGIWYIPKCLIKTSQ